jgi:hypothetical protein
MSTNSTAPDGTILAPRLTSLLRRLRANLDEHVFFWINLLIAFYVFFGVPQITNVWQQRPPFEGSTLTMIAYLIFLSFLIGFYGLSMFVVIRRFPARWVQDWVEGVVSRQMTRWQERGRRKFLLPTYWLATFTWRAPDLCSRWLVWAVSDPQRQQKAPILASFLFILALVGASGLVFGTRGHASRAYPLAGAFCQNMALLCLAAAVWLGFAIANRLRGAERPGEVSLYFGRFIAWLISTALIGELFWVLAYTQWQDNLVSYRLYTIWAIFQLLTTLVVIGLLIDRCHDATDLWPIRPVAVVLIPVVIWLFSRALPVKSSELDRHLTRDQIQLWEKILDRADGPNSLAWHSHLNDKWFEHLNSRIDAVPRAQPVMIVAASGGGSRAAIFTALVLETLARTPTETNAPFLDDGLATGQRTWADNVVLISSVSGGSLATAYHVAARPAFATPEKVRESPLGHGRMLLNTSSVELRTRAIEHAGELIAAFLDQPPEGFPVDLLHDYYANAERVRANREIATTALKSAAPALQKLLDDDQQERDRYQKLLKDDPGLPNAEALALKVVDVNEAIGAVRTALALLDGYESLQKPATAPLGRWLWTSLAFDEMCVDFMAPITRGVLTPALDRGDALARFWTYRFNWYNCTNFSGYNHQSIDDWYYTPDRPAVVFNAVDVARGSRLGIGFPPLPSDLWDAVYQRGVTREVPRALNAPISLARAVRMSSNFPYGFRAMEFQAPARSTSDPAARLKPDKGPAPEFNPIHVLDGGVVDNTGLDTVYELLAAMEYHAEPKNHSPYQARAAVLLANLRGHGVCVLEIDAGAKPNTQLPARFNPFGGALEQSQALENGGYSNADRAKQIYLKEIRRILSQRLDEEPDQLLTGDKTWLRELEESLPPTALHYCIQCNHYHPGQGADPAIMTAWALGPRDKAEVVARFLPELGLWKARSVYLWQDIKESKDNVAHTRQVAQLHMLLDRVTALSGVFQKLSTDLGDLEKPIRDRGAITQDQVAKLRGQFLAAKKQIEPLAAAVGHEHDEALLKAWTDLDRQVKEDDKRLTQIENARTLDQRARLQAALKHDPMLVEQSQQSFGQIDSTLRSAERRVTQQVASQLHRRALPDPQLRYDQANRQAKQVYERNASAKR